MRGGPRLAAMSSEQATGGTASAATGRWSQVAARLAAPIAPPVTDPVQRRWLWIELTVVLAATFALAGYTSVLSLAQSMLAAEPLAEQTQTLNASASTLAWLDLGFQLGRIVRLAAWASLPLVLLWHSRIGPRALGLDRLVPRDLWQGCLLTAGIGIPGLALYFGAVAVGANLQVEASGLTDTWWRIPVLLASALANSAAEEILVAAYLVIRLRQLGLSVWWVIAASALLRGSYHLYQGFGGGLGNLVMGIVCAVFFLYFRRVWPLIVAHFLLDAIAFVGYALLAPHVGWL